MATDIQQLWDHSRPDLSEERFRAALATAEPTEALILKTQIARTYGIRKDFESARQILAEVERDMGQATGEPQVRYWLELGRTYSSATHTPESQTDDARAQARDAFGRAFSLAKTERLDYLAIDALHMMAFVDTEPTEQLKWDMEALAYMEGSQQAEAKKWEGSLRNNVGYALYLQKRYNEALQEFERSREARERDGSERGVRIAKWMMASTYRAMEHYPKALEIQLELEREWQDAGEVDPYVFEELEALYRVMGDHARAEHYAALVEASRGT